MTGPILFLIPNIVSSYSDSNSIADEVRARVYHVRRFIVENEKSARALINRLQLETPQSELDIRLWNEHSKPSDLAEVVALLKEGDTGIISEAGLPCVADPGAEVVEWAHRNGIRVVPLPGSSSLMMALMASGLNGQSFVFHGYLPIEKPRRIQKIQEMGQAVIQKKQSQLFMEAPYRNNALLQDVLQHANASLQLCVACHIGSPEESILTKTIREWRTQVPDLHKKPVVFILG